MSCIASTQYFLRSALNLHQNTMPESWQIRTALSIFHCQIVQGIRCRFPQRQVRFWVLQFPAGSRSRGVLPVEGVLDSSILDTHLRSPRILHLAKIYNGAISDALQISVTKKDLLTLLLSIMRRYLGEVLVGSLLATKSGDTI